MAGDLAKIIGLDDGQPFLLSVAAKEHRRDLAIRRVCLGLRHPLFRLDLLATLDLAMKREVGADHIPRTAFGITCVLLGAPRFLPTLLPQVRRKLPLARRPLAP